MTRLFLLFIAYIMLSMLLAGAANSSASEDPSAFVICDRIKRLSICEEYRLSTLSATDRQLITKHCTVGERCPDENRIGRCIRFTDPDGLVLDKHYYRGSKKKHDWDASTIEETCIQSGGKFEDG
ncbi:hypothetical protein SAMN05216326_10215 [Nitrosomonas marina]|uniref:Uncharacterized protein n=1 Tax=Nitrosomonas marina TaxID=917 RepID=A0A1H9YJM4_9PROT|nr:hypothetical protein [Nitrosomonas marina]SES68784.1 hypothetical protein SAMN05216326_10215 [Nitrosomonas marina]